MHFQYIPYIWILLASAVVAAALGVYAWRHRAVPGATPFAVLMSASVVWTLANGLEMAGTDLPTKLFWANVQYLCYVILPLAWLALTLQYTGRKEWLTRRNLALLSIEPLITVALVWINDLHGLMRRNIYLDTAGPFPVIGKTFGPWFWVHAAYTYVLILLTLYLFVAALRASPLYRRQTLVLLIGVLLPVIWNALYNLGLSPFPRYDVSPAVISLSGMVVAWGLFRYRLFDLMPVARATVIEGMADGVVVLDGQARIVDLNAAARRILGQMSQQAIGRPAAEVFSPWPAVIELCQDTAVTHSETVIESEATQQVYDLHSSPLTDGRGQVMGQVIVFHDITDRKLAQAQLLQQQRALAVLEERERLAREFHDSLGQTLGFVNVQAQAVREMLARGQTAPADTSLARLAEVVQEAQADAREYILGVKGITLTTQGLIPALEQYLQRFSDHWGLHTELILPDDWEGEAFEPVVEVQLLRIIQEALTNVRKHADARSVRLTFMRHAGQAQVIVEDDGRGFDPGLPPELGDGERERTHFGLHIMAERAAGVGGSLQVQSAPGQGTKVIVRVPLRLVDR
jgi:PAS domain S-box-containing protein